MKINVSLSRIVSLLAIVILSVLSFGCVSPVGHPTFGWTKPEPMLKAPPIPPGYKLVPLDPSGNPAIPPRPGSLIEGSGIPASAPAKSGSVPVVTAPSLLVEEQVISSGNPAFKIRFLNPFDFPVMVTVNHGLKKIEISKKGFKDMQIDSGSQLTPYEVYYNGQPIHSGTVKTMTGVPFTTEIIQFTLKSPPH